MLQALSAVIGLGALVCYVMVVIQMFKRGKTGPGLASTLGLIVCGLGYFFAFIYGWIKAGEWRIQNIMIAWTVLIVLNIGLSAATLPDVLKQMQQQAAQQPNLAAPAPDAPAPVVPAPAVP